MERFLALKILPTAEFIPCYKNGSTIETTVDAENGFGARIRSSLHVTEKNMLFISILAVKI